MKYKRLILFFGNILILSLVISPLTVCADEIKKHNYKPKQGYVPNKATAIKIAVAVWIPIYGKKHIKGEKPYNTILKNGVWHVSGSFPKATNGGIRVGGVAVAEIAKNDGHIIRISHGK